jgi:hypothetical protein
VTGRAPRRRTPKAAEVEVEAGEIDQETYDKLIAEGKSERMARAKAKAAYVKKEKARLRAEAGGGRGTASGRPSRGDQPMPRPCRGRSGDDRRDADDPPRATAAAPAKKLGDVHVEGTGEIDQEVFDAADRRGQVRADRPGQGQGRVGQEAQAADARRGG